VKPAAQAIGPFDIVGCGAMKDRRAHRRREYLSGNEQVRIEIQAFLMALDSYPAHFAADPNITFEEHCVNLMELAPELFGQRAQTRQN